MADRQGAMIQAAKRWVKFELSDDVNLGIVTFSDERKVIPRLPMTSINEESRQNILDLLEDMYNDNTAWTGKTCIGCGLLMASEFSTLLNKNMGGNVLLITDGKQDCWTTDECISVNDAIDVYVSRNIRAVTIALGNEADPEIEDLAQRTGGKSFYVEVEIFE